MFKIIAGMIFIMCFVLNGCYTLYKSEVKREEKEFAKTVEMIRQSEKEQSNIDSTTKPTSPQAPTDSTPSTVEKPIIDTPVTKDTEPTQAQTEVPVQTQESTDVPVSPNGFGPYPEIPEEMGIPKDKIKIFWEQISTNPKQELLARVRIKLYQQGLQADGASYRRNGLIYPIIKGVCYVEWDTVEYPDGSIERYVTRSTGHPDDNFMRGAKGRVFESDIPDHLKIYTYPDGGIDPYEFLGLSKE